MNTSNPRELLNLQGSLEIVPLIKSILLQTESVFLAKIKDMPDTRAVTKIINDAIIDDPSAKVEDGGFIREGYDEDVDLFRSLSIDTKRVINELEDSERRLTGISVLKIRYNRVFGYFIEVPKKKIHLVPSRYKKKQSLTNCERYTVDELDSLAEKISVAQDNLLKKEKELFEQIVHELQTYTKEIQSVAENLALLDMLSSFAFVSKRYNYVKPIMKEGSYNLILKNSRHPIIERDTDFIPNDVKMTKSNRVMVITGPNMAGKTCFMRQVALNILMAQIGCFVPASYAEIGIVDKIFCRTGASDDISSGNSTFMVEMFETSQILHKATDKSFIILDEIGRGTSTFDGISIAWSVAEYIAKKLQSKTMFATHYHILNKLQDSVDGVKNYNISVQERSDNIIFLRRILEGGTDKSYGVHVAKLAGMPSDIITKSKEIQFRLENDDKIAEKIIVETRSSFERDDIRLDVEKVQRLIKTTQLTLDREHSEQVK